MKSIHGERKFRSGYYCYNQGQIERNFDEKTFSCSFVLEVLPCRTVVEVEGKRVESGHRQGKVLDLMLVGLISGGHILIEDVPGWARR
jgi:hypothetical protein